jgi:integrase
VDPKCPQNRRVMARSRNLGYGEGSVYQEADGRWRGELRVRNKRRRVSGENRGEVVGELDKIRAKLSAGLPLEDDVRLGVWLDWYRDVVIAVQDTSTRYNGSWAIKQLDPLRGRRLRDLDVVEFEELLADLATRAPSTVAGRGGRSKPLTKSSLNRIKMVLGAALHEAERRGMVSRNIARLSHLPPSAPGPRARRSLTIEEAQKFHAAIERTDDEALLLTPLMLGLRPGEVLGLPWSAVNLDEATMEIRQALKRLPDGQHVIGPPKVNSYRKVRIPDQLVLALRTHRLTQRKQRLSAPV